MSLGIRQERPSAKWPLLFTNILLSVDEHSVVQAAQLEELLLYVGAELVEIVHIVLAAVSCNRDVVPQVYRRPRSVRNESNRIFIRTRVADSGWLEFKRARVCRTCQPPSSVLARAYVRVPPAKKARNIILRLGVG